MSGQVTISEGDTKNPPGFSSWIRKEMKISLSVWRNNYTTPSTAIRRKLKKLNWRRFLEVSNWNLKPDQEF